MKPPVAEKQPVTNVLHGEERVDNYHWMRQKDSPQVRAYLEAENAYAAEIMAPTEALQEKLFVEFKGRIPQTDSRVPYRQRGYWYYERIEEAKQYPIVCRKRGSLEAAEEVLLDLNALAEGHKFLGLGDWEVSDDGTLLAYTLDFTGFRDYTLFVKDLKNGELGPERIEKVGSLEFAADGETLFYTKDDHAKRAYRLYRHRLGQGEEKDALVYEEADERFSLGVGRSRDGKWLEAGSYSLTTSEERLLPADDPEGQWRVLAPRVQDQEYYAEAVGDTLYILTNDAGRNFRVVTCPAASPGRDHWQEFLPHDPAVMRKSFSVLRDKFVSFEREDGLPHMRVGDRKTGKSARVPMPEQLCYLGGHHNPEYDSGVYRYVYESLTTPNSVFELDLSSLESTLLKEQKVLGGYDRKNYESERLFATAEDGTRIPISLVYKKGARDAGPAPMLLAGYGSYGYSYPISFNPHRVSLLDRGVVVAIAHVRGGGEMGKAWHDAGRMEQKPNTFSDFIAAAEQLIAQGATVSDRLVIRGGSAGGLLMGAVVNARPELFKAAVLEVPFVDVINTMSDSDLPLTVGEYEEWGNPKIKAEYDVIKTYCPYTNIKAQAYPAMLVRTSFDDSQVMYWEPAKYVAKLRTAKTDENPLIFHVNMGGGHGGSSGRYDFYKEEAYAYAFILWQLGIAVP